MKEKIMALYDKAKTTYSSYKEATLGFIEELKKFSFWQWYLIVIGIIIGIIVICIVYSVATNSKTATAGIGGFALLLIGWLIIAPIFRLVVYFEEKEDKKKQAKREEIKKELEDFQIGLRDSLKEGRYPGMNVDLYLPEDEFCLNVFGIVTYKTKTRTRNIYYSGLRYRLRIAKGLSYTVGNISPARETISYQYVDDTGILYVTNKRLVIKMKKKTDNIPYDKLLYVELIPGGVEIYKQSGAVQTYYFVGDYDKFPIYLSECLNYQKETKKKTATRKKKQDPELPHPGMTEVIHVKI